MPTHEGGNEPQDTDSVNDSTVPEDSKPVESRERPPSPREQVFARVREQVRAEYGEPTEDATKAEPETKESEESGAAEPEKPDLLAAAGIVLQDGKPALRLKVDGQERLMPLEAATVELQKHESANLRLQQAAERRKELDQEAARLAREREEINAQRAKSQPSESDADDQTLDTEAREFANKLLTGTPDEVAATVKQVLLRNRQAKPAIDPDSLIQQAVVTTEQKLEQKAAQRAIERGLKTAASEFPDVVNDQRLFVVADGMTETIAAEHPDWEPVEIIREACRQTRAWVQGFAPQPADPAPPNNDRQARKEKLRPMPPARTARDTKPPAELPPTTADIVRQMRKARGQAV